MTAVNLMKLSSTIKVFLAFEIGVVAASFFLQISSVFYLTAEDGIRVNKSCKYISFGTT